jgi:hypothetical protein
MRVLNLPESVEVKHHYDKQAKEYVFTGNSNATMFGVNTEIVEAAGICVFCVLSLLPLCVLTLAGRRLQSVHVDVNTLKPVARGHQRVKKEEI